MATAQVIAVDDAGAEQPGLILSPRRPVAADRRVLLEIDHDAEAISTLKVAGPIAIFFLLAYGVVEVLRVGQHALSLYQYAAFAIVTMFFGADLAERFPPLLESLDADYLRHGSRTVHQDRRAQPQPRVGLYRDHPVPIRHRRLRDVGTALAGDAEPGCLALFGAAELAVPSRDQYTVYRWLGFVAALVLSWFTAVFLDRYRGKLRAQMEQLAAAAKFRERQVGTMTHDIRNPLATLVGLVTLLEEDELSEKETTHLLARVGSTSRAMDLLVKNVLDMYLLEEDNLQPHPRVIDPNVIVQEVADVYGREARLKGLRMRTELGGMPRGSLDPLHLERIAANLLSNGIQRTDSGEVVLRTFLSGGKVIIEVQDTGPQLSQEQFSHLFERPMQDRQGMGSSGWKLYIARALTETNGGTVSARSHTNRGLTLTTEVPFWEP